jgi:hypothetical protein
MSSYSYSDVSTSFYPIKGDMILLVPNQFLRCRCDRSDLCNVDAVIKKVKYGLDDPRNVHHHLINDHTYHVESPAWTKRRENQGSMSTFLPTHLINCPPLVATYLPLSTLSSSEHAGGEFRDRTTASH